jgi:hypothetical protein
MSTATLNLVTAPTVWAKPQLVKLGQIGDVAGPISGVTQNSNKS